MKKKTNTNSKDNTNEKEEEIKYYDTVIDQIEDIFTSDYYDTDNIDKGDDEIIKTDKANFTFTTTDNQKNNDDEKTTSIELGQCENELRKFYNISSDKKLYILKIDVVQEGMKIPKVEYDVYAKLNGDKLVKLNISVCQNIKIYIMYPVNIKERIDKYNNNSEYCNNKCYSSTSDDGIDTTLKSRQKECTNNTVCQEDCVFDTYNTTTKKVNCSCNIKERPKSFADMNINKGKILENFIDIKNIANICILSCTEKLFCKNGIIKNIGFYLIMALILFHIITIFIFYKRQKNSINKIIKDIIFAIKNFKLLNINRITKGKNYGNKNTKIVIK